MNYQDACIDAATRQGLDPLTDELQRTQVPHRVEQTGGFTMVVVVPVRDGVIAVVNDGTFPSQPDVWFWGCYPGDTWTDGTEQPAAQGLANLDRLTHIIAAARGTVTATERCELHPAYEPNNCPSCGTAREIGRR